MDRATPATNPPVAPPLCPRCGGTVFDAVGYGLWDGTGASGVFFKARCTSCGTVWYGTLSNDQDPRREHPEWIECTW